MKLSVTNIIKKLFGENKNTALDNYAKSNGYSSPEEYRAEKARHGHNKPLFK